MLAENTLLKTAYHFLLLLVAFDTLTYRMDYDSSPILVGHQYPSEQKYTNCFYHGVQIFYQIVMVYQVIRNMLAWVPHHDEPQV